MLRNVFKIADRLQNDCGQNGVINRTIFQQLEKSGNESAGSDNSVEILPNVDQKGDLRFFHD